MVTTVVTTRGLFMQGRIDFVIFVHSQVGDHFVRVVLAFTRRSLQFPIVEIITRTRVRPSKKIIVKCKAGVNAERTRFSAERKKKRLNGS